ncbi:MAG TPA: hypothetical protein VKB93_01930 [Thermoanaerobaculia bacterium]|nr:hypothetical protein [Thermoanaerobaculia bacterium]
MTNRIRIALLAAALLLTSFSAFADEEYKFGVHNNTKQAIKKILVSEDGEEYGFFNIGAGIKPGATVELVWDSSTNGESCEQYFKAVFADGEESEAVKFDFCEEGLTLEFD